MPSINLERLTVSYSIAKRYQKSLRKHIVSGLTGGFFSKSSLTEEIKIDALNEVSLKISTGERIALMGHNGSGKSTMLRVVAGALYPTKGLAQIKGNVNCMIDITLGIEAEATGLENIYLRGAIMGLEKVQIDKKINEIIEFSGLNAYIDLPVKSYSSGMTVRLAFSIATAFDCDILVMDEWLSVGDADFQKKAQNRLTDFVDRSGILLLATQSIDVAKATCSRLVTLDHGRIHSDQQL
jgi:lipopolysaccharide transport system ATP-binding protein